MARTWVGNRSQVSFLRRLAVVFADPLRLRIVTELFMREMSPTGFFAEFGGGSVPRVDRHFKTLAEHGWLNLIRKESGGRRRGGTEHFYRATELAIFDEETWSLLPYSIKVAFSWRIVEQFGERVREAIDAGTFDARPERHFTWTPIVLDRAGWDRVLAALIILFESVFEEQEDAKLRIAQSGEELILTTVAFAGFESPTHDHILGGEGNASSLVPPEKGFAESDNSLVPFTLRLAKVFADEICLKIVTELNLREMSPTQFGKEFGGSPAAINRRFKMLEGLGWLRKVDEKTGGRRRGATEHFYRATGPVIYDTDTWSEIPDSTKATFSWRIFEQFAERVQEAMAADTFDARADRHLTWSLLMLDQLGWEKVLGELMRLFDSLVKEQEDAKRRLAKSGEEPIRMTVALAAFESPKPATKEP